MERTITLGGKTYTIKPLPIKQAKAWREKFRGPFGELAKLLRDAPEISLTDLNGLAGLVGSVETTLLGSVDTLLELLFDYSPELKADQERIENEAYDAEVMHALLEVVRLAYPFEQLLSFTTGPAKTATSPSSPAPSGAGTKTS